MMASNGTVQRERKSNEIGQKKHNNKREEATATGLFQQEFYVMLLRAVSVAVAALNSFMNFPSN